MKFVAPLLIVMIFVFSGCGSSSATQSSFCKSVSAVKADVQNLKSLKSNPSKSALQTDLKQLQADVQKAVSEAKSSAGPEVQTVKSSITTLTTSLKQVKNKQITIQQALPTLKTQALAVSDAWTALTDIQKC